MSEPAKGGGGRGDAARRASARTTRTLRALLRLPSDEEADQAGRRPAAARKHRFSLRLYGALVALFVVLFGGEMVVDLHGAARRAGMPLGEMWPDVRGSWLSAVQAGGCLARAGYCMLTICLSTFLLAIPFAATFYTPKLVALYLGDRTNRAIFALGVLASANTHFQTTVVWERLGAAPGDAGFYPEVALWANVALVALAWAAILPYAFYALRFLSPGVLLERLEAKLVRDLTAGARPGAGAGAVARAAAGARQGILDLANLSLRAVDRADRDLTLDGVRALGRSYKAYLEVKAGLPPAWFEPPREWFAGLSDEAFDLVVRERVWVAHLLFHQAWLAYGVALSKAPDAAPGIAAVVIRVGAEAARRGDWPLLDLGQRFANTFIREAVKRADARVVRDVARAYRDVLARLLGVGRLQAFRAVEKAADHLRYYAEFAWVTGAGESAEVLAVELARLVDLVAAQAPSSAAVVAAAFEGMRVPAGVDRDALARATVETPVLGREAFGFEAVGA